MTSQPKPFRITACLVDRDANVLPDVSPRTVDIDALPSDSEFRRRLVAAHRYFERHGVPAGAHAVRLVSERPYILNGDVVRYPSGQRVMLIHDVAAIAF